MASLTGQLQTEMRGKAVIQGDSAAPSFMSGLLGVAQGAIGSLGPMAARDEARASRDAKNAAEQASFDWKLAQEEKLNPAYKTAGDELSKAQTAESQGRAPPGSADLRVEKVVSDLYARFPDQKAEIGAYLQGRGFEHYLFSATKAEASFEQAEQATEREVWNASIKKAFDAGAGVIGDDAANFKTGQALLKAEYDLEIATKKAQEARENSKFSREESEFITGKAEKDMVTAVMANAAAKTGPLMIQMNSLMATATGSDGRTKKVEELQPAITTAIETFRANAKMQLAQAGASKEAYESLDSQINTLKDNFTSVFNARYETNKRTVDNMKAQWALDDASALPVYGQLSRLLGQNTVNQLFSGDPASSLPPDVVEALKAEVKGFQTAKGAEAQVILNNIAQLVKGNKKLRDMSEEEARKAMPGLLAAVKGNEQAINRGDLSLSTVGEYKNSYGQTLNAAVEIQPGSPDIGSISSAIKAVASTGPMNALIKLSKDPTAGQNMDPLIYGARGTAVHLLKAAEQAGPSEVGTWKLAYNNKTGDYRLTQDKAAAAKLARQASQPSVLGAGGLDAAHSRQAPVVIDTSPPPSLIKKQQAMNEALTFLVGTAPLDKELPTGWTPMSLRNHYATGQSPVTGKQGEAKTSADAQWDKAYEDLQKSVTDFAATGGTGQSAMEPISFKGASISSGDAVSRLAQRGVPNHIAAGIVGNLMAESELDTGAVGDHGTAFSLAQWRDERLDHAKQKGYDLSNPNDALDFVLEELNTTESGAKKKLLGATTAREAADIFAKYFLRPQGSTKSGYDSIHNIEGRRRYAESLGG